MQSVAGASQRQRETQIVETDLQLDSNLFTGPTVEIGAAELTTPKIETVRSAESDLRQCLDRACAHGAPLQQMHALVDVMERLPGASAAEATAVAKSLASLIAQGNSAVPQTERTDSSVVYLAVLTARRLSETPHAAAAVDPKAKAELHCALATLKVKGDYALMKAAERAAVGFDPY